MSSERRAAVTGSMLRDIVACERRAWHDLHGDDADRDEVGSFVQLLWAQGLRHEEDALGRLEGRVVDLRRTPASERRAATLAALTDRTADHVLGGEVAHGDLLGRPDLISRIDGRWTAGDAKSGSPWMPDGVRPRLEYLAQVGLYATVMGATGLGDGDRAFVVGPDGGRSVYDMDATLSPGVTARQRVATLIATARLIRDGDAETEPAAAAQCGLCHWRTLCRRELEDADDLTLIAEVGRRARATIEPVALTRTDLAGLDLDGVAERNGRPGLPGLGVERLSRFRDRARLQLAPDPRPYARVPLGLSRAPLEWHLDIESDPTRGGHVYLHGIWERRLADDGSEATRFLHSFAVGPDGERDSFQATWDLLRSEPDARVYYYSPFEKVAYRALQARHPDVCAAEEVASFFASPRVVDLYSDVIRRHTEWPLSSYGIKPIAKHLGFAWAAEDASGASSIAWFDEYVRTSDPALRDKIIDYNRSDCQASAVVLDALIGLPVGVPPWPPQRPGPTANDDAIGKPSSETGPDPISDEDRRAEEWRAEGLALNEFFSAMGGAVELKSEGRGRGPEPDDAEAGSAPHATNSAPGARGAAPSTHSGRERAASAAYSRPTLRPCREIPIEGKLDEEARRRPDLDHKGLLQDLPLAGGDAMRPTPAGGIALCEQLRALLPWMEGPIALVERQLRVAVWAGRPWLQWRPFCMAGPPGAGKSHLAREIGRIAGVGAAQLDLGGMHDSAALVATSRGWSNHRPCWPAEMMAALGVANPVLTLDELDKSGGSGRNGHVKEALLGMLEPGTAAVYFDTGLMATVDLSAVCWIATVNRADLLTGPLRSRLDVVEVPPPEVEHMEAIVDGIAAALAARWGVPPSSMPELPRRAVAVIRDAFARRRSVRLLRRHVEDLLAALVSGPREGAH